ncbi:MAG: efflux RND transporter periplasmic adaptor subunit [Candidatus Zixiibacteriota bacterium]|nr:MAG: efflux RND transporter periplasmic adaptor subunit [candidate division Zixibacteria bacterium]
MWCRGFTGCLAIACIALLGSCSGGNQSNTGAVEKIISVKGEEVVTVSKELRKSFTGTLEGQKQAVIHAKISEAVEAVLVSEGDGVTTGNVLVRLDRSGPTSNYMQSYSVFKNAEKTYKKMKYLYEEGAISESQYDGASTDYEVARANFDAAKQLVDISSPIAGTVTSIDVSPGEYVGLGQQVATVAAIDTLRMKLGVNSVDINYFSVGDRVRVLVEAMPDVVGDGKVVTVARSADPVTRSFQVEVMVDNPAHQFKPGMFARADIILEAFHDVIVVPQKALLNLGGKDHLYVVNADRAILREVAKGIEFDGSTMIQAGINPGDTIITVGQNYLQDSSKIKLVRFVNAGGEEIEP